jgi:hypothetical protein
MTYFLGNAGNVRLRRVATGSLNTAISPNDINVNLARVGFDSAAQNIITGDRIVISTEDLRGLAFLAASSWSSNQVENTFTGFVNINAVGGIRLFSDFLAAVNNDRSSEYTVTTFAGADIEVNISVRNPLYNVLGGVRSYSLNTDRETIDATTLSDRFKQQYSAGLISGSGSIDCLFTSEQNGVQETPFLMMQLLNRIEIGSEFDCALYLTDGTLDQNVDNIFYEFRGVVTRAGVTVSAADLITTAIDFVTTGDIRLQLGKPAGYVLQENLDRIIVEPSLGYLLKETED